MSDRSTSLATPPPVLHPSIRGFLFGVLLLLTGSFVPELQAGTKLRIQVFVDRSNEADPNSIRTAVNRWAASLSPDTNVKLNTRIESRRSNWNDTISKGNFDLCGLYSYQYLELENTGRLNPALVTTSDRGATTTFLLLTRTEDKIKSVEQLRGKKIIVDTGGYGELPLIWLATKIGAVSPTSEIPSFATVSQVQTPARALLPLYFGKADACILSRGAFINESELNNEIVTKLSTIHKSNPLLVSMFAFKNDYPVALAERFSANATSPEAAERNSNLLRYVRRDGLARFQESDLDSLRALYAEYQSMFSNGKLEPDKKNTKTKVANP